MSRNYETPHFTFFIYYLGTNTLTTILLSNVSRLFPVVVLLECNTTQFDS